MFKQNVGPLDRVTRIILGSLLLAVKYFLRYGGVAGALLMWGGLIMVGEGIAGYCFFYGLLGWSTRRRVRR